MRSAISSRMPTKNQYATHHYVSIRLPREHAELAARAAAAKGLRLSTYLIDVIGTGSAADLGVPAPARHVETGSVPPPPPGPDLAGRGIGADALLGAIARALGELPAIGAVPPAAAKGGPTSRSGTYPALSRSLTPAALTRALLAAGEGKGSK